MLLFEKDQNINVYYQQIDEALNIQETMKDFEDAGRLIEICLSASRTYKISGIVSKISGDYHTLISDSNITLLDFYQASIDCIVNYSMAGECFAEGTEDGTTSGFEIIAGCSDCAKGMSAKAEKLKQ